MTNMGKKSKTGYITVQNQIQVSKAVSYERAVLVAIFFNRLLVIDTVTFKIIANDLV